MSQLLSTFTLLSVGIIPHKTYFHATGQNNKQTPSAKTLRSKLSSVNIFAYFGVRLRKLHLY